MGNLRCFQIKAIKGINVTKCDFGKTLQKRLFLKCRINLRLSGHELRGKSNGTSPVCTTAFCLFVCFFLVVAQLSSKVTEDRVE